MRFPSLSIILLSAFFILFSLSAPSSWATQDDAIRTDSSRKIGVIFNNLETIGNAYNAGGATTAAETALDSACLALIGEFGTMKSNVLSDSDILSALSEKTGYVPQTVKSFLVGKGSTLEQNSLSSICSALKGQDVRGIDVSAELKNMGRNELVPMLLMAGQGAANRSGLPFMTRLELGLGFSEESFISSVTTVQPLWEDRTDRHHVFTQLSWYKAPEEKTSLGYNKYYDTINAGLAYRYLTEDNLYLYGANLFFDHAPSANHNRMSVGVDARSSTLAVSANKYLPLSDWDKLDDYYEEKAAGGFDLEIRGQLPSFPSWTASVKGYQWDSQENEKDSFGYVTSLEYSPIPALAVRMGVRDETQDSPSLEAALTFNYRFDQPLDLQYRPRVALAPVSDYVYEKVQRENLIRVKQQRRAESKLTVIETNGANTAREETGRRNLVVGQTLLMPATLSVANTVGAIARFRLSDGSVLTLAQNTQAIIEPTQVRLVIGVMQYTSNGLIQTILVPGGTITLHGTDIDVSSDGTDSSVRVRDGAITFVGTVNGSAELEAEEAAESITGVVGGLAFGSAGYETHGDQVSEKIDRVGEPQTGGKVTPYPIEAPRIISDTMTVGGTIVMGMRFNDTVTVSGTPRLTFTINGNTRQANYVSGSGTADLTFSYTNIAADVTATSLTVTKLDLNGGTIRGNGKEAVTTIADTVLAVSGDAGIPAGYSVDFSVASVDTGNLTAVAFTFTAAEVGTTYNYSISSSGGGAPVTGTGAITVANESVTGIDVSGLGDGTLTLSATLTDTSFNTGAAATDTVVKDTTGPAGYSIAFTTDPVFSGNVTAAAFAFAAAEVGATYNYSISSSGGGVPVTGTGSITVANQAVTGLNVSGLGEGTLTVSVTLTDVSLNTGAAVTDTVVKDVTAPTITSVDPPADATYEP